MMETNKLIEKFTGSGLMVGREIVEEIVKRDDDDSYKGLLDIVKEEVYWETGGPGDGWSPFHTFIILGLKKNEKSFEILKYMIIHRVDDLDTWIPDYLPSVFYSFGAEFFDNLKDVVFDDSLDMFVRLAAIDALCAFAVTNPCDIGIVEKVVEVCEQILIKDIRDEDEFVSLALEPISEIKDDLLFERVKESYDRCMASEGMFSVKDLEDIHDGKREVPIHAHYTKDLWEHFSYKNLNYLHKIFYSKPKVEKKAEASHGKAMVKKKKVGRNEPCPCSSGKKYKKCCGKLA